MKKFILAILSTLLVACSSNNSSNLFETISYDTQINDKKTNLSYDFKSSIQLPTKKFSANHSTLRNNIISTILGSDFAEYNNTRALKVYADSSYTEYKKIYDEIYENNPIEPTDTFYFSTDLQGKVLYSDTTILSYQRTLYTFTGGAHGMNTTTNYVFDLKTGKQLTEEDIFGKDFERKIQKLLIKKANILRQEERLPAENEFYNNWDISPNGNFALTDSTIIYTFNPYEIAPYCFGIINIEIARNQ